MGRIASSLDAGEHMLRPRKAGIRHIPPHQREKVARARAKRKQLPKQSKKRKRESGIYLALREQFLQEHPVCEKGDCLGRACDVHHRAGRSGSFYLDERTWLAVCRSCHQWIHDHANLSRELGLIYDPDTPDPWR